MADSMDEDPLSGLQSSEEEGEEEGEEEVPVESLILGRAKRSTAGRHMSALIDAAADDDLTLLFEEVEDDNEFAMEAEAAEEEDMGLDSSSDDDDDQGPNAQNDYEGEKELQKEERKKRKTQNDLRFQTLRKRVKIDPTAVSSVPAAPPRPKKKSERISWLPTPEDGPTRSSSRRQTMVNKELTHARLKDSQEKRIRIIATMKEAEKRKAHLKPKKMTQEDHLAEAERVERLNSKSLNRWEQTEKRKAEERRAKIEALQNRRLEGPVISYWSGLATWTNGRLTRVGKVDIRVKPEKDETKKKKKAEEKTDEKTAAEIRGPQSATPGPSQSQQPPLSLSAVPESMAAPAATGQPDTIQPSDQKPTQEAPNSGDIAAPPAPGPAETDKLDDKTPEQQAAAGPPAQSEKTSNAASPPAGSEPSEKHPVPVAEEGPSTANADAMDVDQNLTPADAAKVDASYQPATDHKPPPIAPSADTQTVPGEATQASTGSSPAEGTASPRHVTPQPASATTPLDPQTSAHSSADAAPMQATPVGNPAIQGHQPGSTLQASTQSHKVNSVPTQPEVPPPPPVIEHTGRNLTILENFDDKTAHSKKYSMYFNARKPPRLTKISSSLCVITSLPSRYRDPETDLPYANSYAYGQIRRLLSQGYIWSSMLGCFVGPAGVAASGVPERFLDKSALGKKVSKPSSEDGPSTTGKDSTNATAGGNTPATSQTELMEVDQ